jgi:hypothetical protein
MRHLQLVLFQLDEARRYIEDGRIPQLRLALLLLDNAAEIQMDDYIRGELARDEFKEGLRAQVTELPASAIDPILAALLSWKPLSRRERREVDRVFDEKVRFLTERSTKLDARLAAPLVYLHKYRNEAYHRAEVRRETIDTAARLLLDVNCEMLLRLSSAAYSYSSTEDYSWMRERFASQRPKIFLNECFVKSAVDDIQSRVALTDHSTTISLAQHMTSRIDGLLDDLRFVAENSKFSTLSEALVASQYCGGVKRGAIDPHQSPFASYAAPHELRFVEDLRSEVSEIHGSCDRFEAFRRFSLVESRFEELERDVRDMVVAVDGAIQMEIDRSRGK